MFLWRYISFYYLAFKDLLIYLKDHQTYKEEGIYTIDGAPKKFIKCYNEKINNNILYFLFFKFDSSIETSEFDLSKMDKDAIEGYLLEKKLHIFMILKLEHKTSHLLIIFLVLFFIVLVITNIINWNNILFLFIFNEWFYTFF